VIFNVSIFSYLTLINILFILNFFQFSKLTLNSLIRLFSTNMQMSVLLNEDATTFVLIISIINMIIEFETPCTCGVYVRANGKNALNKGVANILRE